MKLLVLFLAAIPAFGTGCQFYGNSLAITLSSITTVPVPIVQHIPGLATTANGGSMLNSSGFDHCYSDSGNTTKYSFEQQPTDGYANTPYPGTIRDNVNAGSTSVILWWNRNLSSNPSDTAAWSGYNFMYHLGESGTTCNDSTASPANCTGGSAPVQTAGVIGYGRQFNGTSTYLEVATAAKLDINQSDTATVCSWFNTSSNTTQAIVSKMNNTTAATGWEMTTLVGGKILVAIFSDNTTSNQIDRASAISTNLDGRWHLACFTYDGTAHSPHQSGDINIYIDGALSNDTAPADTLTASTASSNVLLIGRRINTSSGFHQYFNGIIDEVFKSGSVWTAGQIAQYYANSLHPDQTITAIANNGTGPTLSSISCAANSDTSIACKATSNNAAAWQVACGASSGNYTLATPLVYESPWMRTTPEPSYGIALTGLAANTAYHCVIRAYDANGYAQSSDQTATTNTAIVSKAFRLSSMDRNRTRYNDQRTGNRGFTSNSRWFNGDINFGTLDASSVSYRVCNDCTGVNGNASNGVGIFKYDSTGLNASQINGQLGCGATTPGSNLCGYSDGSRFGWNSGILMYGNWYPFLFRYNSDACCTSIMWSPDSGVSWIAPQNNVGPATVARAYDVSGAIWNSTAGGTFLFTTPVQTQPLRVAESITTSGLTPSGWNITCILTAVSTTTATCVSASSDPGTYTSGTVTRGMKLNFDFPTLGNQTFGDTDRTLDANFYSFNPIQPCPNYTVNCTWQAGTDGWVYMASGAATGQKMVSLRVEHMRVTNDLGFRNTNEPGLKSRWTMYTGGDGNNRTQWSTDWSQGTVIDSGQTRSEPYMYYFPSPFNRFAMGSWTGTTADPSQSGSSQVWDCGATPWAGCTLAGSVPRDPANLDFFPTWSNLSMQYYASASTTPAVGCLKMHSSGSYVTINLAWNGASEYGPNAWNFCVAETGAIMPKPVRATQQGSAKQFIARGLSVLWGFGWGQRTPYDIGTEAAITNWSPNDTAQKYAIATTAGNYPIYDQYGMFNFGMVSGVNGVNNWSYNLTTPFGGSGQSNISDFLTVACFDHQSTNAVINSGEMLLDKTDLQLFRNTTTANSWKLKVGSTTSSAFALTTDNGEGLMACVIARRTGLTTTIYNVNALGSHLPLTSLTTVSDATALTGTNVLHLGSTVAGGSYFYGSIGLVGFWSGTYSDQDVLNTALATKSEMTRRGVTLQ